MSGDPIGRLKARVRIEAPAGAVDPLGGQARVFVAAGEAWAELETVSTALDPGEDGAIARARIRVGLRAPCAARPGWRLIVGARTLRVAAIAEQGAEQGAGQGAGRVILDCVEEQS